MITRALSPPLLPSSTGKSIYGRLSRAKKVTVDKSTGKTFRSDFISDSEIKKLTDEWLSVGERMAKGDDGKMASRRIFKVEGFKATMEQLTSVVEMELRQL